jgi:hypothetical protein
MRENGYTDRKYEVVCAVSLAVGRERAALVDLVGGLFDQLTLAR